MAHFKYGKFKHVNLNTNSKYLYHVQSFENISSVFSGNCEANDLESS